MTKAASSTNSSVRSRGSRHKRSRTLPPLGDDREPLEEDDVCDTLEDDLSAMISECQAEEELSQKALCAQMLAEHSARARVKPRWR